MDFAKERQQYIPPVPELLRDLSRVCVKESPFESKDLDIQELLPKTAATPMCTIYDGPPVKRAPLKVGVCFSGGQAPGGHNVIAGLFDALVEGSTLIGFENGPIGVIEGHTRLLTKEIIDPFRNQGGFDLIGSGRDKIDSDEKLAKAHATIEKLGLDGLVIIGGDDSNTNAALLAEYLLEMGSACSVIGVPKTIDGDLRGEFVEISFGFDTATRTYSEMIGNICRDALSAKKYTHFIKLMGRSASHIALECAHNTHPNLTLIGEEIAEKQESLADVTTKIADLIEKRAEAGKNYGVILIPEGVIEFIPEVRALIKELNHALGQGKDLSKLTAKSKQTLDSFPDKIKEQLLMERDPHGNVQVSKISLEELLILSVKEALKFRPSFKGKFNPQPHFMGYEGRAAYPTNFDSNYCAALGRVAALLIMEGKTSLMASVGPLTKPPKEWIPRGLPLPQIMTFEERGGVSKGVIKKSLVDLEGKHFQSFAKERDKWAVEDHYIYPGPIQYFGNKLITDLIPNIIKK